MGLYTEWAYTRVNFAVSVRWAYTWGGLIHEGGLYAEFYGIWIPNSVQQIMQNTKKEVINGRFVK